MTSTGMHQLQEELAVPRLTDAGRNILRPSWDIVLPQDSTPQMDFTTNTETELLLPDNKSNANDTFLTIMTLLNQTPSTEVTTLQSYYASAIVTMYPDLEGVVTEALAFNGIGVIKIKLPSEATAHDIQMATNSSGAKSLIMLGQLLMIPFKNLTAVNYLNFMNRRILAMKSFIGISLSEVQLLAVAEVDKVIAIRSIFGQNVKFRQTVLKKILHGGKLPHPFGNFYTYISEILAWTEMAAFTFIADTLLETKSPVLRDPRVQHEVRAFSEALYAITRYSHPQYYRVLGPARGAVLLERGRYAYLFAVAQAIKSETYTTLNQFAPTIGTENHVVRELVTMHKNHIDNRRVGSHTAALRFLDTFSGDGGNVGEFQTMNPAGVVVPPHVNHEQDAAPNPVAAAQ